jgi:hypothetical protein
MLFKPGFAFKIFRKYNISEYTVKLIQVEVMDFITSQM